MLYSDRMATFLAEERMDSPCRVTTLTVSFLRKLLITIRLRLSSRMTKGSELENLDAASKLTCQSDGYLMPSLPYSKVVETSKLCKL